MDKDTRREMYYYLLKQFLNVGGEEDIRRIIRSNISVMTSDFLTWLIMSSIIGKSSDDPEQIAIANHIESVEKLIKSELKSYFILFKEFNSSHGEEKIRQLIRDNHSIMTSEFMEWLLLNKLITCESGKSEQATIALSIDLIVNIIEEELKLSREEYCIKNDKDVNDSLKSLSEAIDNEPYNSTLYYNRAVKLSKIKDYKRALQDLSEAIKLNPDFHLAYYKRGIINRLLDNNKDAIKDFDVAIKINPAFIDGFIDRGGAKYELGDFKGALNDLDKAINLDPNDFRAYYHRGLIKYEQTLINEGLQDINKTIELNPKIPQAYYYRGNIKRDLNDIHEAIKDYDIALELKPDFYDSYYNRGVEKLNLEDFVGALEDFKKNYCIRSRKHGCTL